MRIAYLENRLTEVGKTFVRTELAAVAAAGHDVRPFSVRRPPASERAMTEPALPAPITYLLAGGASALFGALAREGRDHPGRLMRAGALALATSAKGVRGRTRALVQWAAGARLGRRLRADRVEHLHNHATASAPVALVAATVAGIPYSVTSHGPPEFDPPLAPHLEVHVARAAFVAAVSHAVRAEVCRMVAPEHWDSVHVVHCGLPDGFLTAEVADPVPEPRLVCVARLEPRKGQPVLLAAAERLVSAGHELELVLVGDGALRPELEAMVAHGPLRGRVNVTGWLTPEGVREQLRRARVLVLPSFAEGLPISIMEALALGRPVVATAVGAVHELVRPGETGWLVAPTDVGALHDALREVLATPPDRLAAMGRRGAEIVRERHSAAREADRLLSLIARR